MKKYDIDELKKIIGDDIKKMVPICNARDKFLLIAKASDQSVLIVDNTGLQGKVVAATGFFEDVKMVERLFLRGRKHKKDRCQMFIICNLCGDETPFCISTNAGFEPLVSVFLLAENTYDDCLETVIVNENLGVDSTYSIATAHSRDEGKFFHALLIFHLRVLGLFNGSKNLLDSGILNRLLLGSVADDE